MPNIWLVPTRATVSFSAGETSITSGERIHLAFKVKPEKPWRREIRLTTGEKFNELDGSVTLRPGSPPADWKPVRVVRSPLSGKEEDVPMIGTLTYWEKTDDDFDSHPANYLADLWIPESQFTELILAARSGKLPKMISIEVVGEGIKYGWEPDGSGKDWDNKEKPQLAVTGVSFTTLLAADAKDTDDDEPEGTPDLDNLPVTRAQAAEMHKLLAQIASWPTKLFWVILGCTIIYLVVKK